jgi:hypothetical protein
LRLSRPETGRRGDRSGECEEDGSIAAGRARDAADGRGELSDREEKRKVDEEESLELTEVGGAVNDAVDGERTEGQPMWEGRGGEDDYCQLMSQPTPSS